MEPGDRSDVRRRTSSLRPCPVCGRHTLALERPPHIPVAGPQPFTELYCMGDLPMPIGVRCRSCGTWWPTITALEAGEPGSSDVIDPVDGLVDQNDERQEAWRTRSEATDMATVAALGGAVVLSVTGVLELVFIAIAARAMAVRALRRRRQSS